MATHNLSSMATARRVCFFEHAGMTSGQDPTSPLTFLFASQEIVRIEVSFHRIPRVHLLFDLPPRRLLELKYRFIGSHESTYFLICLPGDC